VLTLAIDASSYAGSVAVLDGDAILAEGEAAMRGEIEERLMPAVADALSAAGVDPRRLGRVVCGAGPGSFTSLRIAAAIAKGMAAAAGCPLYVVPTALLALAAQDPPAPPGRYLVHSDALRGQWFATAVELPEDGIPVVGPTRLIDAGEVPGTALERGAAAVEARPHARGVARLGAWLAATGPVPLDGWEPTYGRAAEAQVRWEAAHGRPLAGE
jgi:tRNA threonylcarbamoyladenosine biosynthesis protein TsaB